MEKIKLLLIDEKMNSVDIEIEPWQFKQLQIDRDKIKKHKSRSALNKTITEYLLNTVNN